MPKYIIYLKKRKRKLLIEQKPDDSYNIMLYLILNAF